MLMNVKKPLSVGDSFKLDLVFEKARTISIVVPVVQDVTAVGSPATKAPLGREGGSS
jgi:copper(I)-binding protein